MFKLLLVVSAMTGVTYPKPLVVSAPLVEPAPVVTATSSQYYLRNTNNIVGTVSARYVVAPDIAVAAPAVAFQSPVIAAALPYTRVAETSPALTVSSSVMSSALPYIAAATPTVAVRSPFVAAASPYIVASPSIQGRSKYYTIASTYPDIIDTISASPETYIAL